MCVESQVACGSRNNLKLLEKKEQPTLYWAMHCNPRKYPGCVVWHVAIFASWKLRKKSQRKQETDDILPKVEDHTTILPKHKCKIQDMFLYTLYRGSWL